MNSYTIGSLAEKILAVKIGLDGNVTPYVRRREPSGRMIEVLQESEVYDRFRGAVDFVARISKGHTGVVSLDPPEWYGRYAIAAIPLGEVEPYCDREVDFGSTFDEPCVGTEEVRFHLENGKLTWESESVSGEAVINETYPALNLVLRLPPGAEGEIEIGAPVSDRFGKSVNRLLSAA